MLKPPISVISPDNWISPVIPNSGLIGILFNKLYIAHVIAQPPLGPSLETEPSPVWIFIPDLFCFSYFSLINSCLNGFVKFQATVNDICILSFITSCCNPVNFNSKNLSEGKKLACIGNVPPVPKLVAYIPFT